MDNLNLDLSVAEHEWLARLVADAYRTASTDADKRHSARLLAALAVRAADDPAATEPPEREQRSVKLVFAKALDAASFTDDLEQSRSRGHDGIVAYWVRNAFDKCTWAVADYEPPSDY